MTYTYYELLSYFASAFGFILVVVILSGMRGKDTVKLSLSALLFLTSFIVVINTLTYSGKILNFPHLIRVESPFDYLLGPACLFYTLATFKPELRFRWVHLINILPFLINIIVFLPFYLSSSEAKIEYYHAYMNNRGSFVMPLNYMAKATSAILYFSIQIWIFLKYKSKFSLQSKSNKFTINWFYIYLAGQANLTGSVIIDNLTGLKLFNDPYIFSSNMISLFLYSCVIALLFFPGILYGIQPAESAIEVKNIFDVMKKEKYHYSTLNDSLKEKILISLGIFMKAGNKPYLDPEITLLKVAENLKVNPQHLSQVINEKTSLNFSDYINSHRVEEAKLILVSPDYKKLTIEAIAHEVGFNSKSPFNIAFKKYTGITPKEFAETYGVVGGNA
jgi:AraC-like DNA-binding protein